MLRILGIMMASTALSVAPAATGVTDPLTFELCGMGMTAIWTALGRGHRVEPVVPEARDDVSGGGIRYIYDAVAYKGVAAKSIAVLYGHAKVRGQDVTDHGLFDRPAVCTVSYDGARRPFSLDAYRSRLRDPDRVTVDPGDTSLRVAIWQDGGVRYRVFFDGGGILRTVVDTGIGRILERLEAPLRRPGMERGRATAASPKEACAAVRAAGAGPGGWGRRSWTRRIRAIQRS